jgi:two-component response regulator (ARR-B family)
MGKSPFSLGEGLEHSNLQNGGQHFNPLLAGNSTRVKSESVPDASSQTNLFPDHYGQDDLMSALLKQVTHLILCSFF